ncbi:MAG: hypothetical protein WC370_06365 [Dehalococcoidales bacterium]|jgi:uncharacterized Zn finger protein
MTTVKTLEFSKIIAEPLHEANGYCPRCHSVAHFTVDKGFGYLKRCPSCGNLEYLRPRVLKFDQRSRQWR